MITGPLAKRYAKALVDLASESGSCDRLQQDLSQVASWIRQSPELSSVMKNPSVPLAEKLAVLDRIWAAAVSTDMSPQTRKVLHLLIQNHRIHMLGAIVQACQEMIDQRQGTMSAVIFSSVPLSAKQREDVIGRLQGISGFHLRPDFQLDEKLIGGIVVKIGSTVYDGSVRNQLEAVKKVLSRESST